MKNVYEIRGEVTAIYLRRKEGAPLTAVIDTIDLERLLSFNCRWRATWSNECETFYVKARYVDKFGTVKSVFLHRFITGAPDGLDVDHFDHSGLNNRRLNLRIVTVKENSQNILVPPKTNTSGYLGVSWRKREQKWRGQIQINRKNIWLGLFDTKEEAAKAVAKARARLMPYSQEARGEGYGPTTGTG